MTLVILFVFGAVVGSFLNVVGSRWGTGRGIGGRSECPRCGKILKWWELVPVVSFLFLRARCRTCHGAISWQYPIIEVWTGLIFASVFDLQLSLLENMIILSVFCIYIVITIYDLWHKIIPDFLVYSSIALGVALRFISLTDFWDWLAGPILFAFFASLWFVSRGRAIGFGDAKLGLSIGLLLGAAQGFSAIVLAFWIGALVSVLYVFLGRLGFLKNAKGLTIKSEVPFAPFIVAGAWIALVFDLNILHVALF